MFFKVSWPSDTIRSDRNSFFKNLCFVSQRNWENKTWQNVAETWNTLLLSGSYSFLSRKSIFIFTSMLEPEHLNVKTFRTLRQITYRKSVLNVAKKFYIENFSVQIKCMVGAKEFRCERCFWKNMGNLRILQITFSFFITWMSFFVMTFVLNHNDILENLVLQEPIFILKFYLIF